MTTQMPADYYNRHDPDKNYEQHLFVPGAVQTAEFNELQSGMHQRIRGLGDALWRDGDVIRDARLILAAVPEGSSAPITCRCESGAIYLRGAVRGVPPAELSVPSQGAIAVGIYLQDRVVTHLEDPSLRDPAVGTRNYQEPGAARLQVNPVWGYAGDGQQGEFYPVYLIEDGSLRAKEAPPAFDAVSNAIAIYDRDSSGGTYIVSGYSVSALPDTGDGQQVYTVSRGRARINGYGVELVTDRRLVRETVPTLRTITAEPHLADGSAEQLITLDRYPVAVVSQVSYTVEKTVNLTRGMITGGSDALPDSAVLELVSISQGGTDYAVGSVVRLYQGRVDWSLTGAEPAGGSTYTVTYRYIKSVVPAADELIAERQISVSGAVPGTLIMIDYACKLPRLDRLCLTPEGEFVWIDGVPDDYNPRPPAHPASYLPIALVTQTWTGGTRSVSSDAVRVVSMGEMAGMERRMDELSELLSRQQLALSGLGKEAGIRRGQLVDSFVNDNMRDLGVYQGAVIADGVLTLPVRVESHLLDGSLVAPMVLQPSGYSVLLAQESRTGDKKINPYQAFPAPEAVVSLNPPRDHWTSTQVVWAAPSTLSQTLTRTASETKRIGAVTLAVEGGSGLPSGGDQIVGSEVRRSSTTSSSTTTRTLGVTRIGSEEYMREIDIEFDIAGFGPNEPLNVVKFDGIVVAPTAR